MSRPQHHVSDFALLQFMEVEYGVDVRALRATLAWRADAAGHVQSDATSLTSHGLRLHVSGGTVCGVNRISEPEQP